MRQLGGDPARLFDQLGLGAPDAAHLLQGASYRQTAELLELAAKALNRPDFGLRLASRQCVAGPRGLLGDAMRHSLRFGDALEVAARHSYAHSLAAGIWLRRSPSGASIVIGHEILLDRLPARTQVMEMILLCGHLSAMWLTGGRVREQSVLTRCCRRWFDESPTQLRSRSRWAGEGQPRGDAEPRGGISQPPRQTPRLLLEGNMP